MNKNDIEFYKELMKHLESESSEAILIDDEKKYKDCKNFRF